MKIINDYKCNGLDEDLSNSKNDVIMIRLSDANNTM